MSTERTLIEEIRELRALAIVPKDANDTQIKAFIALCKEKGVSSFNKEIYFIIRSGKPTMMTSINGLRKIARNSGGFVGCSDPKYNLKSDGTFKTMFDLIEEGKKEPVTCTVTVKRASDGIVADYTHTVSYKEFAGSTPLWRKMPFQMIAKVAESFAIKKAYGDSTSEFHITEELDAFNGTHVGNKGTTKTEKEEMTEEIKKEIDSVKNEAELNAVYRLFEDKIKGVPEYLLLFADKKQKLNTKTPA